MRQLQEIWTFRYLIANLASKELKLKYRQSILGWLWALIQPASMLAVYTVIFGYVIRLRTPQGANPNFESFAIYLFSGLIVWNYFSQAVSRSGGWLLDGGSLLKRAYFPAEALVISGALTATVQTAVELAVLFVVLTIVGSISVTFLYMLIMLPLLFAFTLGLSLLVSLLNVRYRDVQQIVLIGTTLLFYATPILYPLDLVPARLMGVPLRTLISMNPLTHFVQGARESMYFLESPHPGRMLYLTAASTISLAVGWWLFKRRAPYLPEEL